MDNPNILNTSDETIWAQVDKTHKITYENRVQELFKTSLKRVWKVLVATLLWRKYGGDGAAARTQLVAIEWTWKSKKVYKSGEMVKRQADDESWFSICETQGQWHKSYVGDIEYNTPDFTQVPEIEKTNNWAVKLKFWNRVVNLLKI